MSTEPPTEKPRTAAAALGREDRLTGTGRLRLLANRARGWVLCTFGRHLWAPHRNPEVSGASAQFELCRRCGHERNIYDPPRRGGMGNAFY